MSDYYVVESQSLSDVADAIREKTGGTADLEFPDEFVSEIGSISGGGEDLVSRIEGTLTSYESDDVTVICAYAFREYSALTSFKCHNVTDFVAFPGLNSVAYCFYHTALTALAFPKLTAVGTQSLHSIGSTFQALDLGDTCTTINNQGIAGNNNFDTLILRRSSGITAAGQNNILNNTKFANGGAGGTIYIPKALYDHLGDGTSLDYKAATNWSTINGYGTITWAKIEGSYYETHYADGTVIQT